MYSIDILCVYVRICVNLIVGFYVYGSVFVFECALAVIVFMCLFVYVCFYVCV